MAKKYMKRETYLELKKELQYLRFEKRPMLSKRIEEARAHGDLKENAEYHEARDQQGLNEARISQISSMLAAAEITDDLDIPTDAAYIGAKLSLLNMATEDQIEYTLVPEDEVDFVEGKISVDSPVARALLGKKVDEVVEIDVPAGKIIYKIEKIERD